MLRRWLDPSSLSDNMTGCLRIRNNTQLQPHLQQITSPSILCKTHSIYSITYIKKTTTASLNFNHFHCPSICEPIPAAKSPRKSPRDICCKASWVADSANHWRSWCRTTWDPGPRLVSQRKQKLREIIANYPQGPRDDCIFTSFFTSKIN